MGIAASHSTHSRDRTASPDASQPEEAPAPANSSETAQSDLSLVAKPNVSNASSSAYTSAASDDDEMSNSEDSERSSDALCTPAESHGEESESATALAVDDTAAERRRSPTNNGDADDDDDDSADASNAGRLRSQRVRSTKNDKSLAEFREELRIKREQRRTAIADLKNEVLQLRRDLAAERASNGRSLEPAIEDEMEPSGDGEQLAAANRALRVRLANVDHQLQLANGETLSLNAELEMTRKQVQTLKEVVGVSKGMIDIREQQLEQLKTKLKQIEDSLAERELSIMSDTLRQEYDRQLANIRSLRTLYEDRARVSAAEKENLMRQLDTKRTELETEIEKSQNLESRLATLETDLNESANNLSHVKDDLIDCRAEKKSLEEESAVINQLFSQLLTGFNGGNDLQIDKLSAMLEDNRDLLSDITSSETCRARAAAMPKLLLDLTAQMDAEKAPTTETDATDGSAEPTLKAISRSDISANLPKVWKVLIELLNHQQAESVPFRENGDGEDCYKTVQSASGPQNVLSVSKTYIRLKDLIVEKKYLQKETHKLKNLNSHLETRLDQRERRLAAVTVELNKTWSMVGRMQRQRRQLHTNEQVLRYQLSQKRRMLNELKEELEYCRRKWTQARQKNDESQTQWTALRREFNARKLADAGAQQSAESGYSDDPASDDDALEGNAKAELPNEMVVGLKDEAVAMTVLDEVDIVPVIAGAALVEQQDTAGALSEASGSSERKKAKKVKLPKATGTAKETLEDMFYRISGQDKPESDEESSCSDDEVYVESVERIDQFVNDEPNDENICCGAECASASIEPETAAGCDAAFVDDPDEERRLRRAVRFERLEDQCKQLMEQVRRNSTRGDVLNMQLDNVQNRHRPMPTNADASATSTDDQEQSSPNDCLTAAEEEYSSRRARRLQRLEAECQAFLGHVVATNDRATALSEHASNLHEHHSARLAASDSVAAEIAAAESAAEVQDILGAATAQNSTETRVDGVPDEPEPDSEQCAIESRLASADAAAEAAAEAEAESKRRRSERLQRLEAECSVFLTRMTARRDRAGELSDRASAIHDHHVARFSGSAESTPIEAETSTEGDDEQTASALNASNTAIVSSETGFSDEDPETTSTAILDQSRIDEPVNDQQ